MGGGGLLLLFLHGDLRHFQGLVVLHADVVGACGGDDNNGDINDCNILRNSVIVTRNKKCVHPVTECS